MITLINSFYLIAQFGRFTGFIALSYLMLRDTVRGKNHFTPGILIFSIGNIINSAYSVLDTLFITPISPYGFFVIDITSNQHAIFRLICLAAGAWLMFGGGAVIAWATLRGEHNANG